MTDHRSVLLYASPTGVHSNSLFAIPPRDNARGHVSGTWRHDDCLCDTIQCRIEKEDGCLCVIRLIREDTGELFAMARFPHDVPIDTVLEPACDSSRTFVIRVEDPETKRHAFLGLVFEERAVALDIRMTLGQEKRKEALHMQGLGDQTHREDLSLKEGQLLHLSMEGKTQGGGGFVSRGGVSVSGREGDYDDTEKKDNTGNTTAGVVARHASQWETF